MNRVRRNRLIAVVFLVVGAAATVGLVLVALNENINLFYPPDKVVSGAAPLDTRIRAGGMVEQGSLNRSGEGLEVEFVLTDLRGSSFPVRYSGILPDLFREGQGVLVQGELQADGVFRAQEVLAKHDENYMPPEIAHLKQDPPGGQGAGRPGPGVPAGTPPGAGARGTGATGAAAHPADQLPAGASALGAAGLGTQAADDRPAIEAAEPGE